MPRRVPKLVLLLAGALCCCASPALASGDLKSALGPKDSGTIAFYSNGSLQWDSQGTPRLVPGPPIALSGDLEFPPKGTPPYPLVVIAHGCNGLTQVETGWASVLRSWGYATFVMDSFSGREIVEVCTAGKKLLGIQRIPDAFGAIRRIGKHPRIDAKRIALMGFSHGGIVALTAATAWAKKTWSQPGDPAFRAFFPFYPYCNGDYPERAQITAPVRIHIGELDSWTPAATCKHIVDTLKASGQDADITIYKGAQHSFDYPDLPRTTLYDADNTAACTYRFPSILGPYGPALEGPGCVKKGAIIEGNSQATRDADRILHAQLNALLK